MSERTYTQEEVEHIKTEERFIAYLVLSSARVPLQNQPKQYRDARQYVIDTLNMSSKYDDITKERFGAMLVMIDNCVPVNERPVAYLDAYNSVIKDILAPADKEQQ